LRESPPELQLRLMMSYFPTGVAVVTATDEAGSPYGITCSSLTSVCLEPPTILVSIATRSKTLRHALQGGVFGITLLEAAAYDLAQRFSTPTTDRFAGISWRHSPLGTPWFDLGMTAAADCEVCNSLEVGDHTVLFGVVRTVTVPGGAPLLYGLRKYRNWQ